jgi:hypothetical protein
LNRGIALRALLAVCAVFAALTVTSAPASAAVPCWKALLNDWYDGTINNVYPIPCYHQAIQHLPLDVSVYSSARQDIERALQRALATQRTSHKTVTAITPTTPVPNKGSTGTTGTTTTTPVKKKRSPVSQAIRDITPGGPGSFPLPLLILGLLAILLVLAGVGGLIWRRYQGRGGPPPSPA